jgi:hypothetical protein
MRACLGHLWDHRSFYLRDRRRYIRPGRPVCASGCRWNLPRRATPKIAGLFDIYGTLLNSVDLYRSGWRGPSLISGSRLIFRKSAVISAKGAIAPAPCTRWELPKQRRKWRIIDFRPPDILEARRTGIPACDDALGVRHVDGIVRHRLDQEAVAVPLICGWPARPCLFPSRPVPLSSDLHSSCYERRSPR